MLQSGFQTFWFTIYKNSKGNVKGKPLSPLQIQSALIGDLVLLPVEPRLLLGAFEATELLMLNELRTFK